MDFLSIRKKARERAEAREAGAAAPAVAPAAGATPPAAPPQDVTAPPPAPPEASAAGEAGPPDPATFARTRRGTDTVITEEELQNGVLQERYQGLAPTTDGRFATWRPGFGPPPVEPDERGYERPVRAEPVAPDELPELELDPLPTVDLGEREPPPRPRGSVSGGADPLDVFFYRPDEEAGLVPALAGGSAEEPPARAPETLDEFLTFLRGDEEYAVAIDHVREVLRAPAITEVPRAPANVLGVVTVRGEVVAVVDTRARLGLAGDRSTAARIVIVDAGDGPLGLLVDAVTSVVRLPRGSIEPCPQGIATGAADCVTGIGRQRERLFMIIDASAILPGARAAERG